MDYSAPPYIAPPNMLQSYLQGQMAPMQVQQGQQQLQQGQQALQTGALNIDQLRMAMQSRQMITQSVQQDLARQNSSQGGAQGSGGPTGGIQNGPQAAVGGDDSYANKQAASGAPVGSDTVAGFSPTTLTAISMLQSGPEGALKTAGDIQSYQIKQRQLQVQGPMALADTVATSPNADMIVKNNPSLQQQWIQNAPKAGFDPFKDLTPANARTVARMSYNALAGSAGLPTKEMPAPDQQISGPLGSLYSKNPISGDIKQEKPEEDLKQVIGDNGQPTYLPASQAAGKTPYNASLFGAGSLSDQAKDMAYQTWVSTGALPANMSRNPAMQANMLNYIAQKAQADGNTAAGAAAKSQMYKAQQGVVTDFTKGKSAQTLNGINTAVQHMDLLNPLIDNLDNTNSPLFNKAANFFKQQTGSTAPTNFSAIKEFVGGEVAKAVLPGGGGEGERQALTAPLNAANSPDQLKQAVQTIQKALAGKTEALRNQWDVGTNGTQGDFNKFLLPATKQALGQGATTSAHPPDIQALLDKYK